MKLNNFFPNLLRGLPGNDDSQGGGITPISFSRNPIMSRQDGSLGHPFNSVSITVEMEGGGVRLFTVYSVSCERPWNSPLLNTFHVKGEQEAIVWHPVNYSNIDCTMIVNINQDLDLVEINQDGNIIYTKKLCISTPDDKLEYYPNPIKKLI